MLIFCSVLFAKWDWKWKQTKHFMKSIYFFNICFSITENLKVNYFTCICKCCVYSVGIQYNMCLNRQPGGSWLKLK